MSQGITGVWNSYKNIGESTEVPFVGKETMSLWPDGTGVIKRKSLMFRKIKVFWSGPDHNGIYLIKAQSGEKFYYAMVRRDGLLEAMWIMNPAISTLYRR